MAVLAAQASQTQFRRHFMQRSFLLFAVGIAMLTSIGLAQQAPTAGPYKVLKTAKVGGEGGFDYIFADVAGRRLYIPRNGPTGQLMVFNLDTLGSAGTIANLSAGGATVDPKSHHGFSTTRPAITMWDSNTLKVIKTIDVGGRPDGIMLDPYNERVWVLSHEPPYATVIDAKEGAVVGTLDLGGGPEQAVSDGKGTIYVNISDKANIAVVNAKNMAVTAHYDVSSKSVTGGSGLALDAKNHILFAYYRELSPTVVIVNADNGNIIASLPTGTSVDTVAFNPATMESISAEGGGSMTFIKESSPTTFVVEQTLPTMAGAKTLALDTKTNRVLTMSAEYEPAPAGATPRTRGRPAIGPMVTDSFSILMVGK
jgi:DNA-binding beta-propeller fold protein YncE